MSTISINGGGMAGLALALMLADDGHRVLVVERDGRPSSRDPEVLWEDWERRSVPQFRQSHAFLTRARDVLYAELPHVAARLLEAGVIEHNPAHHPPRSITDRTPRPGDERFGYLLARRCTVETVLYHAALDHPAIDVLPSTTVNGVLTEITGGVPRVTGLATSAGAVAADIVVDCGGRHSKVSRWVVEAGGLAPIETVEEYGLAYWTLWFRARAGRELPPMSGRPVIEYGPFGVLRAPADAGWFSITALARGADRRFRAFSDREILLRALRRLDGLEEWLDPDLAEPVGHVMPMFRLTDVRRHFVVDDRPCATGIAFVGDSIGASNPGIGRGFAFALAHAAQLRRLLRDDPDPSTITQRQHEFLDAWFEPWWQNTRATDDALLDRFAAARAGCEREPTPAELFVHAAEHDPQLWRHALRIGMVLDLPSEVMTDHRVQELLRCTLRKIGPPRPSAIDVDALLAA